MKIIWFALLAVQCWGLSAQQYLYIKKNNDFPAQRLAIHDRVNFKMQGEEDWAKGTIEELSEESIRIDGVRYPLDEIAAFRTRHQLLHIASQVLWKGTLFFTGIVVANGLINNDRPLLTKGHMIVGAGLVGAGVFLSVLNRQTYEKDKGWRWVVIDLNQNKEP